MRGWIKDDALRAIDIGKDWRIADRDLEDFPKLRETRARDEEFENGRTAAKTTWDHDG